MGRFVRIKPDAVPQVMIERPGAILVENRLGSVEDLDGSARPASPIARS